MSERMFFDKRLTVPGFTFILIVLIVNLSLLYNLFLTENVPEFAVKVIGILLGNILSAPAIGFLVSQLWYFFSQHACILRHQIYLPKNLSEVLTKYKVKSDDHIQVTISDHILHSWKCNAIRQYQERRWDLLNLMGSVWVAIPIGLVYGYYIKWVLLGSQFYAQFDLFVIIPLVALFGLVYSGIRHVREESLSMLILMIRLKVEELKKEGKKLRDVYPKEYFN